MNLWSANAPDRFWLCEPAPPADVWAAATEKALPILNLSSRPRGIDELLEAVLGEGQLGPRRWELSGPRRLYYQLKPWVPRSLVRMLRRAQSPLAKSSIPLRWPVEDRYARFLWEVLHHVLLATGQDSLAFRPFWPEGHTFALVLTHDVEQAAGQDFVRRVADLEERLGFRSSFNFVADRYPLNRDLLQELVRRGFEVGVHGLKHEGQLFSSRTEFQRRAIRINQYLRDWDAVGFRAPYVHRNAEWMQELEIEYDASFFDTDPFEPMPGGTMSIWPFFVGRFVELPYTLVQDHTLAVVLGDKTIDPWLQKVAFIERYHGMALILSHPDYLRDEGIWRRYADFLRAMQERGHYWHALPRDVARWWRARAAVLPDHNARDIVAGKAFVAGDSLVLEG